MLSAASSPSWVLFCHGVHCRQKLHQKLLSKTSTNGNHQVLVLLASSDLESNQLPSAKLVNRMWLQHNLVFQVEHIKEEQCRLCCNRWGCYRWVVGIQLSLRVSCCYHEHSSSNRSNWHVKICHQISLWSTRQPKRYRQDSVQQGLGENHAVNRLMV